MEESEDVYVARLLLLAACPVLLAYDFRIDGGRDESKYNGKNRKAVDFMSARSLEDILRYGGSKVMRTLQDYHSWLFEEFGLLGATHLVSEKTEHRSIPLSAACMYFTCGGFLKMKTAILVAGMALNPRWRQSLDMGQDIGNYCYDENGSPMRLKTAENTRNESKLFLDDTHCDDDLHISLQEFEELFLRCAFALYEQAGFLSRGKPSISGFEHCKASDIKMYVQHYCDECDKTAGALGGKSPSSQFSAGRSRLPAFVL